MLNVDGSHNKLETSQQQLYLFLKPTFPRKRDLGKMKEAAQASSEKLSSSVLEGKKKSGCLSSSPDCFAFLK